MNIFSGKVNLGRQIEIDVLRGFTALDMIICHVGLYLGDSTHTGLWTFCDISGSEFAAPVFMVLMGISIVYSRHQDPKKMLRRGVLLFIAGYALNAFRSLFPLLILGPVDEWASVAAFFVVDILPFAGLSFMAISLFKKLKLPSVAIFAVSVALVILDQFIMLPASVPWDSELLTGLVNLFCPVTDWSCFPFLTWFFFPAFGLVFGDILTHCNHKNRLYGVMLPVGLLGVLYVYDQFYRLYPDYTGYYFGNNFYYMGLKNAFLTLFFVCFSLAFWFFAGKILPKVITKFLCFLSRNLNTFYIISWIIISILIHAKAVFAWNLSASATIGLMVLLIVFCAGLTKLWLPVKNRMRENAKNRS